MPIVTNGVTYDGTNWVVVVGSQVNVALRLLRGLDESPEVRGIDTVIPTQPGRTARNRVVDRYPIEIGGPVMGVGADAAAQATSFRATMDSLRGAFSNVRNPATLVIALGNGQTATLSNVRPINIVTTGEEIPTYTEVSIELEGLGPTGWVIA